MTRRRVRQLLSVVVMAATASAAAPAGASAQAPAQDSAVGSVSTLVGTFPGLTTTFDARSGPLGENPTGSARVTTRASLAGGPVTCLTVSGNRATIGFRETEFPFDGAEGGMLFVEDNGTPGVGRDRVEFTLLLAAPTDCPINTIVFDPQVTVVTGDLTVVDAQPSPTSKEQCKDGGYVQFGFRNQGQCVAFVARGPKP